MKKFFTMVLQSLISNDKSCLVQKVRQKPYVKKKEELKPGKPFKWEKMILTVYLSNNEQVLTEVPITPETSCRDVVEFCKEPGETGCHLAEVWRGNERAIPVDHMMYEHLQKWGPRRQEVTFFLRHEESPAESSEQGGQQAQDQLNRRNGVNMPADKHCENGVGNPRAELTLSELQEMATRQQQQIEAQQQMLVAKEQRLRYLKQQERRQQQSISESEKLQKLKERVENQEAKLKKIRAMRGQVDYSKVMNGNLSAEVEHINAMFQEKQLELQSAVLKVDQLSQQLEDLRKGKLSGFQSFNGQVTGAAALELKKLYQELQIRNKLNQEQNSKLQHQKEALNKRNMEVSMMDKRVNELRDRLYKKKAELNRINGIPSPQPVPAHSGRVAAVGPYIQVPAPGRPEGSYHIPGDPVKPQSLTVSGSTSHARSKSETDGRWLKKSPGTWKVSDLDIIVDPVLSTPTASLQSPDHRYTHMASSSLSDTLSSNDANWPTLNKQGSLSTMKGSHVDWKESSMDTALKAGQSPPVPSTQASEKGIDPGKVPPYVPNVSKQLQQNYGTYPSPVLTGAGSTSSLERRKDASLPRPGSNPPNWQRPGPPGPSATVYQPGSGSLPGSSQQIQHRISVPPSPSYQPGSSPVFPPGDNRPDPPLAVAVRPFLTDKGSRPQSPRKGPQTVNSSSIYSMYLQQATPPKSHQQNIYSTLSKVPAVKAVYGKPVLAPSSAPPSPLPFLQGPPYPSPQPPSQEDGVDQEIELENPPPPPPGEGNHSVDNIHRPLSPTKLTPIVHSPMRYQSDADLEFLRKKLANAPRPLKKRSSITEPEGPSGPNIQKLLYQRFNTLAGGMESTGTPFYQPTTTPDYMGGVLADVDNGNLPEPTAVILPPASQLPSPSPSPESQLPSSDANDNDLLSPPTEELTTDDANQPAGTTEDSNNNPATVPEQLPSPIPEVSSPEEADDLPPPPGLPPQPPVKRTNLKKPNSERTGHGLRVKFNPLALLLDASLEGEFDLVQRIIYELLCSSQVENPSTPNDEGITPLHNAVCAGHHHIVKFLLDFGVNVNAADSDGWTPLHCAASCNSVHLCKLLVESGAAIFASTISDVETAADKCEEMEEGYIQCSQFLYGVQEKMGVMNKGTVYALWQYEAQNNDELSFREGDAITILRRKDDSETEWWWGRLNDKEGYVPRNLLGLYPRIKQRQRSLA
ncbi:apoptosis-stimulating of p53 protein 1 isoform X4 [Acipenser ruthenus]|uniref:apoptosis-stimulating of p53 protein 1 isoform X4 n=1 Tax=Acipenser ruthenus TaxID=7906 RepID=UPI002741B4A6|nr:apoptosis-stimulating of p53 protein 1 isoform X4 [Acipenser ruthenus]